MKTAHSNKRLPKGALSNAQEVAKRWFGRSVAAVKAVMFEQMRLLNLVILVVFSLFSVYMVYTLLFTDIEEEGTADVVRSKTLATDVIDELELWIEERQSKYETGLIVADDVFVSNNSEQAEVRVDTPDPQPPSGSSQSASGIAPTDSTNEDDSE